MEKINSINIEDILDRPFTFTRRPELLPCEMRPLWKCSLILLIVHYTGRSNACSLKKLHIINWMLKSEKNSSDFEFWISNPDGMKPEIRLDPTLDRALELLICDGILLKNGDKFSLTDKGLEIVSNLISVDVFEKEVTVLNRFKKALTETNVNKIFQVR